MESAIQKVRASKSPSEALLALAQHVDELQAILTESLAASGSDDGWGSWEGASEPSAEDEWAPDPADEAALAQYEDELQGNGDAEESRVLRAKIELTRDRLKPPVELHDNSGEATETHYDDEGNAIVDLPKPTPAQIDARAELLPRMGLQDQYGPEIGETAEDSFVRGGPLLLYLSDRDYVNSLPHDVKTLMVEDVILSSPREGHEMGRDILKASTDESNDLTAITDRILGDVESGAIHNAP